MNSQELILKNKNSFVNLALICLAIFISYNTIYKGQAKEEKLLRQRITEETKKNEVLKRIGDEEAAIGAYKRLLPTRDTNLIISTFSGIAGKSGVTITSYKPAAVRKHDTYITIPFNLEISAPNYHALGKFIGGLENYQDVYIVDNIIVKPDAKSKERSGLTVNLSISSIAFTN